MSPDTTHAPLKRRVSNGNPINMGLRIVTLFAVMAVGVYVALSPSVVYAPTPKIILYLLISLLPAILFSAEIAATFEFRTKGLIMTATGVFASILILLWVLTWLSKPEREIAVFHILDEQSQPVGNLDRDGAVEIPLTDQGLHVTKFIDRNTIVLLFPPDVGACTLRVRPSVNGPTYSGTINYAGNRESTLQLGKHLKVGQ